MFRRLFAVEPLLIRPLFISSTVDIIEPGCNCNSALYAILRDHI
jgi:hypothetical protein